MEGSPHSVGENVLRTGLAEKVRGDTRYTADLKRPGLLHGRILYSAQRR